MRTLPFLFLATFLGLSLVSADFALGQFLNVTTQTNDRPDLSLSASSPKSSSFQRLDHLEAQSKMLDVETTGSIAQCPKQLKASDFEEVEKVAKEVVNIVEPALKLTGKCPEKITDLAEDVAKEMRTRLGPTPKIRIKKDNGKMATTEDWVTVDLLARTLYGEIGGSSRCSNTDANFKAVGRVIMNRRDFMHAKADRYTNFLKSGSTVNDPLALAAISPNEFQVWKEKTVGRWIACPGNQVKQYKDANGKVTSSVGPFDTVRWFAALEVATEMVFKQNKFRCETKDVKGVFYSKSSASPGKDFRLIKGATVDGQKMDDAKCVQLWENPKVPWKAPEPICL
jgi:hypothetical protein